MVSSTTNISGLSKTPISLSSSHQLSLYSSALSSEKKMSRKSLSRLSNSFGWSTMSHQRPSLQTARDFLEKSKTRASHSMSGIAGFSMCGFCILSRFTMAFATDAIPLDVETATRSASAGLNFVSWSGPTLCQTGRIRLLSISSRAKSELSS